MLLLLLSVYIMLIVLPLLLIYHFPYQMTRTQINKMWQELVFVHSMNVNQLITQTYPQAGYFIDNGPQIVRHFGTHCHCMQGHLELYVWLAKSLVTARLKLLSPGELVPTRSQGTWACPCINSIGDPKDLTLEWPMEWPVYHLIRNHRWHFSQSDIYGFPYGPFIMTHVCARNDAWGGDLRHIKEKYMARFLFILRCNLLYIF